MQTDCERRSITGELQQSLSLQFGEWSTRPKQCLGFFGFVYRCALWVSLLLLNWCEYYLPDPLQIVSRASNRTAGSDHNEVWCSLERRAWAMHCATSHSLWVNGYAGSRQDYSRSATFFEEDTRSTVGIKVEIWGTVYKLSNSQLLLFTSVFSIEILILATIQCFVFSLC